MFCEIHWATPRRMALAMYSPAREHAVMWLKSAKSLLKSSESPSALPVSNYINSFSQTQLGVCAFVRSTSLGLRERQYTQRMHIAIVVTAGLLYAQCYLK